MGECFSPNVDKSSNEIKHLSWLTFNEFLQKYKVLFANGNGKLFSDSNKLQDYQKQMCE